MSLNSGILISQSKDIKLYSFDGKIMRYSTHIDGFYQVLTSTIRYDIKGRPRFIITFRRNKKVVCTRYICLKKEFNIDVAVRQLDKKE